MQEEEVYHRPSLLKCLLTYLGLSAGVGIVSFLLLIFGLYVWANSLNTCRFRPPSTLLSFIEESIPMIARPIQKIVCP